MSDVVFKTLSTTYLFNDNFNLNDNDNLVSLSFKNTVTVNNRNKHGTGRELTEMHIFRATYSDGTSETFRLNSNLGDMERVWEYAEKLAKATGEMPSFMRELTNFVVLNQGRAEGSAAAFAVGGKAYMFTDNFRGRAFEEILAHEMTHTSVQAIQKTAGWKAAQKADGKFITNYALSNPGSEDISETLPVYLALRLTPEVFTESQITRIEAGIPHRLAFLDQYFEENGIDIHETFVSDIAAHLATELADYLIVSDSGEEIHSLAGNDIVIGSEAEDQIYGGEGNDTLYGNGGVDYLDGGEGDDQLRGGEGEDTLDGGNGDDLLNGGNGDDLLRGGAGDDRLIGGNGEDVINGGDGVDHITGGFGDDFIMGGRGGDLIFGGEGDDLIAGNYGNDTIHGDAGNDHINGGFGSDTISGGEGDDELLGHDGMDILNGGAGDDILIGGRGADHFVFNTDDSGYDRIKDFGRGNDTLELSRDLFDGDIDLNALRANHFTRVKGGIEIEISDDLTIFLDGVRNFNEIADHIEFV